MSANDLAVDQNMMVKNIAIHGNNTPIVYLCIWKHNGDQYDWLIVEWLAVTSRDASWASPTLICL